jgi:streptomycin 6-kinase
MSVVIRCRTADARNAVCKLCPDTTRLAREAAALQSWTTPHAPTVFAADTTVGALLIEAIEPGTSLAEAPTRPSVDSVADMLSSLHDQASTREGFPSVTDRIAWLFDAWDHELNRNPELRELMAADLPARGRHLAMRLAADLVPPVLLHGDLNPGNLLDGGPRRGLVAIDPAPCIGDAAFDATDLVFAAATDPEAISSYIEDLAPAARVSPDRLLNWCIAFAGMDGSEIAQAHGQTPASEGLLALAARAPAL